MMRVLSIVLLFSACTGQVKNGIKFHTLEGDEKYVDLAELKKGAVFVFLLPDCPFSQFYSMAVNQVYSVYKDKGYRFYGVVPGNLYSSAEIDTFKARYNFLPEILIDKKKEFTQKIMVEVVPQVVFMDRSSKVLYTGKIDDQAIQTGQKKYMAQAFYLLNALKEYEAGQNISIKSTQAVGCFIE